MEEYIKRNDLLDIVEQQGYVDIDDILNINIADVAEVKHGYWKNDTICSVCNGFSEDANGHIIISSSKYCPHCGAKMDNKE